MSSDMSSSATVRVTGRVKWFNNKRGYGFVTTLTGDTVGVDVFAHHSGITTSNEQFLYLVQGEYIDFDMNEVSSEKDEAPRWEASNITGFGGGKLMCETRYEHQTTQDEQAGYNYNRRQSSNNNRRQNSNYNSHQGSNYY